MDIHNEPCAEDSISWQRMRFDRLLRGDPLGERRTINARTINANDERARLDVRNRYTIILVAKRGLSDLCVGCCAGARSPSRRPA